MSDSQSAIQIVLFGERGVGKTSVLNRLMKNEFEEGAQNRIGLDFQCKEMEWNERRVKLIVWEVKPSRFSRSDREPFFLQRIQGVLLCYDISSSSSFTSKEFSKKNRKLDTYAPHAVKLVLGLKSDLEDRREVPFKAGSDYATTIGASFLESSAKKGTNITEAFCTLLSELELYHHLKYGTPLLSTT